MHKKRPLQAEYFISDRERHRLHRRAYRAQQRDHSEVCGALLVDQRKRLTFWFLKNHSVNRASYEVYLSDMKTVTASLAQSSKRILGTFHSHPVSEARPGTGDLKRGFYRGIELIYDVCGREMRLWQQKKQGKRKKLKELPIVYEKGKRLARSPVRVSRLTRS